LPFIAKYFIADNNQDIDSAKQIMADWAKVIGEGFTGTVREHTSKQT